MLTDTVRSKLICMTTFTLLIVGLGILGTIAAAIGTIRFVRDPRRISAYAYSIVGLGAALMSLGLVLYLEADSPHLLITTAVVAGGVLVLGNLIGYPGLIAFLIWAGVTTVRRESRTLANMLSLIAGIGLLFLPTTLALFEPADVARDDLTYHLQYGIHLGLFLLVTYIACCFGVFIVASVAYRFRKLHTGAAAIIVLGSGLINGKVPPLLADRLQRGMKAQQHDVGHPVIITSGGQGANEPRPEGAAMRDYLIDQGVDPERVIAEEQSTTTEENLVYSQRLLPENDSPVTVVTSNYHVFRAALLTRALGLRAQVVGAPTVWYYLPGAIIREFVAVMRDHLRIHVIAVVAIIALTMAFTHWIVPALVMPA